MTLYAHKWYRESITIKRRQSDQTPVLKHTTLKRHPPNQKIGAGAKLFAPKKQNLAPAPKILRHRQIFGWWGGGGGVTLKVVCLTQGLVTLPTLVTRIDFSRYIDTFFTFFQ